MLPEPRSTANAPEPAQHKVNTVTKTVDLPIRELEQDASRPASSQDGNPTIASSSRSPVKAEGSSSETGDTSPKEASHERNLRIRERIGVLKEKETTADRTLVNLAQWRLESDNPERYALHIEYKHGELAGVNIHSPYLVQLLRDSFKSFPGAVIGKSFVSVDEPFAIFYHHWDEILDRAKQYKPKTPEDQDDLEALELFYLEYAQRDHDKIRQNLELNAISFGDLWALYRPGTLLYSVDSFNEPQLYYTIGHRSKRVFVSATSDYEKRCIVDCWHVTWDQSVEMFTRTTKNINITDFHGTRTITSLPLYPFDFYGRTSKGSSKDLEDKLEARGQKWKDMVSQPPSCHEHAGPVQWTAYDPNLGRYRAEDEWEPVSFLTPSTRAVAVAAHSGRVMLDQTATNVYEIGRGIEKPHTIQGNLSDSYADFDAHLASEPFTRLQAQLCPSFLAAFSLKANRWCLLLIDNLIKTQWNISAMEHLVMERNTKMRLEGLVTQHSRGKAKIMGDVIDSKGRGLIIVLFGPPGVGKTFTAESIAEHTNKPLYQISLDNQGKDYGYSLRVQYQFKWAARWGAILLLDEADIVLEKRSWENLQRNGVVSAFLHALEYYEGIIFLTSNRLKTMDIAFQSRIHIAIEYKDLEPPMRREIWMKFIKRLPEWEEKAKKEMSEHLDDMEQWNLNGRQIRNVLIIAQSVVLSTERRKGALRYDHVVDAVNATLDFQNFFDKDKRENDKQLGEVSRQRPRFKEF